MTSDDRDETITDRAAIRDSDEPDERTPNEVHVDESGCSCKTGPYRGFQRDPIDAACPKHGEPLRHGDGDVTVCHPDGSTTIIREPDERGDFPYYDLGPATSETVGALDLDAIEGRARYALEWGDSANKEMILALVAEVRRLTVALDMGGAVRSSMAQEYDALRGMAEASTAWRARAEAAEAEVRSLRAKVAAVEALAVEWEALRDRLRAQNPVRKTGSSGLHRREANTLDVVAEQIRAALATGEGK